MRMERDDDAPDPRMTLTRRALATLTVMALAPSVACAQVGAPADTVPPTVESAPAERVEDTRPMPDVERLAGDALVRAALTELRKTSNPSPLDYRVTALAIRIARRLNPNDEELVRLEQQAWQGTGDEAEIEAVTREVVRIDPKDTVAQLRLVTSRIRRLQDADLRLVAYDRMLGQEGTSLDAAIRSRLALDAALLSREAGDDEGFIARLTQAATLDNTNKDAAALYSTYFLDRATDPVERADLLANVVLADPNDMQAHTNLALELFRKGAYKAARRFMARAGDIAMSGVIEPTVADLFDRFVLLWMTDGDEPTKAAIMALENKSLSAIRDYRRRAEAQGIEVGEEPEPTVPQEIELIRLAIGWSRDDQGATARAAHLIVLRLETQLGILDRKEAPYDKVTPEEEQFYRDEVKLLRGAARLWAGVELDEAQADIDALLRSDATNRLDRVAEARLTGLMAMRRGDFEGAERLLTSAGDDPTARLGLGALAEQRGDRAGAIRAYAALALDHAHRLVGCAAKKRIEAILGKPLPPTPDVAALEEWSNRFAPWLDEMTTNPTAFMTLDLKHVKPRIDAFERVELRLALRNVSRIPMSVGPDQTFSSRLMLSPRAVVKGQDVSGIIDAEFLELDRRLRLMPGEAVETVVWGSRGSVGNWFNQFADKSASLRWRAIQGYRLDNNRRFAPGIISVTAQSDMLERDPVAPETDIPALISRLEASSGREHLENILRAVVAGGTQRPDETDAQLEEKRIRIGNAIAARLSHVPSLEKAWIISSVARVELVKECEAIVAATEGDPSPMVQAALVIDGYADADHPGLVRLGEDPDPELRAMARAARERLRGGRRHEAPIAPIAPPEGEPEPEPAPVGGETP